MKHYEFRRQVAAQLCATATATATETETEITAPEKVISHVISEEPVTVSCNGLSFHQMSQVSGSDSSRFRPYCYVCIMYNERNSPCANKPRVSTFCRQCKLGFHPMCFTAYHNPDGLLDENLKAFMKSIHPAQHKYMFKKKKLDMMKESSYYFLKKDD